MKSKLFKQHQKDLKKTLKKNPADEEEDYDAEVDYAESSVSSAKGSKLAVIASSAILITVVVYFLFFKNQTNNTSEKLEEVNTGSTSSNPASPSAGGPAPYESLKSLVDTSQDEETYLLERPRLPEIPKLPEILKDLSFNNSILPTFLDIPKDPSLTQSEQTLNPINNNQALNQNNQNNGQNGIGNNINNNQEPIPEAPRDPRKSPIVVESSGVSDIVSRDQFSGGIVILNQNPIDKLKKTESSIIPTVVSDKTVTITQGKMMTAVLETAINTEIPGSIRGIISRDVYAEAGNNILIPKGSRVYGNYSSEIVRGQGRVEVNWTRLIRPDGVDLKIAFVAADQFGRSGIEGDIDNKYGTVLTNSLLTSVLAVGGAIAAEKLSGNGDTTTTTDPTTGTSTATSSASAQVITDVSRTLIDTVGQVVGNAINVTPAIRIPQGTRITIIVNSDMTIPPIRKRN
jgi:type IV secretory pathway VirB10-like protein